MYSALSEIFGFRSFRPHQEEIVRAILDNRDAFAVMPTGGGKSLCYQLPAAIKKGVCVVVSPLISLMKDQVDAANANGLHAGTLNSMTTPIERESIGTAIRNGKLDLLYVSPERFNTDIFIERLKTIDIAFFAIDEAHCISEWGHDFRPDYRELSRIVPEFPNIPVAAFTATATPKVAQDIIQRLGLRSPHMTRASFNRPNLFYSVQPKTNVERQIIEFLKDRRGESGIIYRTTRKNVEATAQYLQAYGLNAKPYHAGMLDKERIEVQEAFRRDECPIIVATIAFGMGIDKSNVRFVVHGDLPKNIEGYYQETGRSGRDGEPARCLLFFGRQDIMTLKYFAEQIEDEQAKEIAYAQLNQMIHFAEHDGCRRSALLAYFGESFPDQNCNGCDVCCGDVERIDATIEAQKALSAMHRTGGRFGATHIADILVGANTEKIRQWDHDTLPTYGVGKEHDKVYWRRLIDALLAQGLASVDDPRRPTPKVTEEGWKVLRKQKSFQMIRSAPTKKSKATESRHHLAGTPAAQPSSLHKPMNSELETLQLLREGKSLYEIGAIRNLKQSTMLAHIDRLVDAGFEVPFVPDISPKRLEQIAEWFRQAKSWNLTPVVEQSGGQLDYDEARLARMVLKQRRRGGDCVAEPQA